MVGWYLNRADKRGTLPNMLDGVMSNRIVFKDQGQIRIIPIAEIVYLEADDDYINIHTTDKSYMKKATLTSYEKRSPSSNFTRIH